MVRPTPLLATAFAGASLIAAAGASDRGQELFELKVRPTLADSCYSCHSQEAGSIEGELTLDNRAAVQRGGRRGAVVVPGDPDASLLIQAIEHRHGEVQMPPGERLPLETIDAFREWVALGAPDPRGGAAPQIDTIATRSADHWAFQPPRLAEPPQTADDWPRTEFDALIAAKLHNAGHAPTDEASREALIRRLYFDLSGLAPTAEQVRDFVESPDADAYERLVDRLLDSPRFGERWARHWLDVARFADTKGYVFTEDRTFPNAYKYRDWVIAAFNDDMPVDRFLQLQLAADLLTTEGDERHLAAQGFVTLGRRFINNQHDIIADRIDVVFRGMMGLTVACARCHDHKYDPISDEDYYALYGVFTSSVEQQDEQFPLRLVDKEQPENVGVFIRGSEHNRGAAVERGFPEFFGSFAPDVDSGSGRRELAAAITSRDNPLTARVYVNRVWGHLFGEQLVRTPSDFGLRCEAPPQQAVLDHLAVQFMDHGWSTKWLVREIVSSSSYRQSAQASPELLAADAENVLWGRANRRRLDFESLRDRLLDAAGLLAAEQVGGPSENIAAADGGARRTLYAHIDRQNLPGLFRTFDFASPDAHSPERPRTLVPQQALYLMNNPIVQRSAEVIAGRLTAVSNSDRVHHLYRRVLGRDPREDELTLALDFLARGEPAALPPGDWTFGYGAVATTDSSTTVSFAPLVHFSENRWQPEPAFPNEQFGYVCITPTGGHPGNSAQFCSIRRWTSPDSGELIVRGQLERHESQGDGVDGMIVSSKRGMIAKWTVVTGAQPTPARVDAVQPGEIFDFVVDCRETPAYDSFQWKTDVSLVTKTSRRTWRSEEGFHGPEAPPLDRLTQLAQVLLVSNEFLYVD
ncbi:Planctomycete cytochrome C [Posidoniimonas corsicana]|uniref:Planctomycete cytochrome C n=1 Tax=Posidoniimonas corsicana TaxID=1938618 RepID=A0A5C5VIW9_9BACT|nr:PSD1 and planctomycete cytochrome C domain-containing protein [Posidoniimonas corsicana]TWT37642.1 Planctomycete cytochrome C [Posidoniimonas corsicana]